MSLLSPIEKWYSQFRSNFFTHKKGFYELPYTVNSPNIMIERFKKMPFIKYDEISQSISARTPFLNITVYYRELEEKLFLIHSEARFKTNVSFRHQYDKSVASEFYCLSLRIDHYAKRMNSIAHDTGYADNSWLIFKPEAKVNHHHFKGTSGKYFSIYFTRRWLEDYIEGQDKEKVQELLTFIQSDQDHLICPQLAGGSAYDAAYFARLVRSCSAADKDQTARLKKEVLHFLSCFISKMHAEKINGNHFELGNSERIKVLEAERILQNHVYKKFPGIEYVAAEIGLSETKLKESFKKLYGKTLFRYFQSLQLEKAKEILASENLHIAEVAQKLSYENASKFSAAFKEYHGCLPSEMRETD